MIREFTHGSLFSGIGGFDLGFERAGFKTIWQVEIDQFCRKVLEKNFPDARRFHNIKRIKLFTRVDVISGGFPCQDISLAGRRSGIAGSRSGLYREMVRAIRLVRPIFAVVENVAALTTNGLGSVLGDMAAVRYDAEWDCISANDFGAPHGRDRIWITFANADEFKRKDRSAASAGWWEWSAREIEETRDTHGAWKLQPPRIIRDIRRRADDATDSGTWWKVDWKSQFEAFRRMDDGISAGVDDANGIRALGNSLVPQIAEWIAHRIKAVLEAEEVATEKHVEGKGPELRANASFPGE